MDYLRQLQANDDDRSEALRALGGLLLGVGLLVLLIRKSSFEDPWGDFPILLVLLVGAAVLYGGGIQAARAAEPKLWHAVWVVFGIGFVYASLLQFLELIGGTPDAPLNTTWTLLVVAAVAAGAAIHARVRFGWLVAGVAASVAWLALWDEILGDGLSGDIDTFRILCMVAAGGLIWGAWRMEREGRDEMEASELVTAAGLIFVLGAGLISFVAAFSGLFVPVDLAGGAGPDGRPTLFWDLVLLAGSVALIGAGNLVASRGPVYVGAAGLALFVVVVGSDLDDDSPSGAIVGWPLLLIALAAAAIFLSTRERGPSAGSSAGPSAGSTGAPSAGDQHQAP